MRQGVEQDLARLRKMLDDTYMSRMQLEGQIESMREELAFLKKSHEEVHALNTLFNSEETSTRVLSSCMCSGGLFDLFRWGALSYRKQTDSKQNISQEFHSLHREIDHIIYREARDSKS